MIPVLIAAYAFLVIGGIMMLIAAFRESVLWGVACLLLPVVSLIFLIIHWQKAKLGFVFQLIGLLMLALALIFAPETHA